LISLSPHGTITGGSHTLSHRFNPKWQDHRAELKNGATAKSITSYFKRSPTIHYADKCDKIQGSITLSGSTRDRNCRDLQHRHILYLEPDLTLLLGSEHIRTSDVQRAQLKMQG
jgi:hypothetical protein